MTTFQPRKPAGVPVGGQFANKTQPAPGYSLEPEPPMYPEAEDSDLRVDFSPDAIRAHFEAIDSSTDDLSDDQLREVALGALDDPRVWEAYHMALDAEVRRLRGSRTPAHPVGTVTETDSSGRRITTTHLGGGRREVQVANSYGMVELEQHWKGDKLTDRDDGTPAEVVHRPDGVGIETVRHYRDGKLNDAADGSPAVVTYRRYGGVKAVERYTAGVPADQPG